MQPYSKDARSWHDGATGLTKREYAAIHLRVPDSGDSELDRMIRQSMRDEMAAKAMQGLLSDQTQRAEWPIFADAAYELADAMLAAREAK